MLSPNLVFLHGWGTSPWVWEKQVEYFSTKYHVEFPGPPLHITHYTLHSVIIGWSYGGMLAIELTAREPTKYKALVLIGCSARFTDGMKPVVIKNLRRNLIRDYETTMRNCYGAFFSNEETVFIEGFIERQVLPDKMMAIGLLDKLSTLDLKGVLKDISIPTLIIHGDKDEICPLQAGRYLHMNIKNSRLEVIKGAAHMPFYTRPREFNKILEDFINAIK